MSIFGKPIEEIVESDIQELLENTVPERQDLEYKLVLPDWSSQENKTEFLRDVSAFANTHGGHVIFGMEEGKNDKRGIPVAMPGIELKSADQEMQRIQSILRDNVDPTLTGVQAAPVRLNTGNWAVVLRIPRSWALPHMVTSNKDNRFYGRNSGGKYRMNTAEIRNAFLLSTSTMDHAEEFRKQRLEKIEGWPRPVAMADNHKIILHMIPLQSFDAGTTVSFQPEQKLRDRLPPLVPINGPYEHGYLYDGFITRSMCKQPAGAWSYSLLFRNGIIEGVDCFLLHAKKHMSPDVELSVLKSVSTYVEAYKYLQVFPPIMACLALSGINGYVVVYNESIHGDYNDIPIAEEQLILPPVVIQDFDADIGTLLRPAFDRVWNACGMPRSLNFDENGNWMSAMGQ